MKQYYIIGADGQQQGPFTEEYVRGQYLAGVYKPNTPMWCEGMPQWAPLSAVFAAVSTPYAGPKPEQISNPFKALAYVIRNMFKFSGRARRKEYWMATLGFIIVAFIGLAMLAFPVYTSVVDDVRLANEMAAESISGINEGVSEQDKQLLIESYMHSAPPAAHANETEAMAMGSSVLLLLCIPLLIFIEIVGLSMNCRRLHDLGYSGWLQLISFVPYIGGIVLLILCCLDSKPGPNQYGPNPKGM